MQDFLDGATALACCAIALFFLRFWRTTRDRLFGILALAFVVFAINRVVLTALGDDDEARTLVYLVRLVAFALIAVAIIDKNRPRRPRT
jgi:glucose uptake protein GlcU